ALRFAEAELDTAIADLKSQRLNLDSIVGEARAKRMRCVVLECDVSQQEEVKHMVQATET
ncbi:hypothetical protein EDB19DRAFT_1631469, partial [Suillus lakei]